MAKEEKKKKRIKGQKYWQLQCMMKKLKEKQSELTEWQAKVAEDLLTYPDLLNWNTGAVFNDTAEIVNGMVRNGKVVGRIPQDDYKTYQEKHAEIKALDAQLTDFRNDLAKALGIWPDMISYQTGEIDGTEYEGVDPDDDNTNDDKDDK